MGWEKHSLHMAVLLHSKSTDCFLWKMDLVTRHKILSIVYNITLFCRVY